MDNGSILDKFGSMYKLLVYNYNNFAYMMSR